MIPKGTWQDDEVRSVHPQSLPLPQRCPLECQPPPPRAPILLQQACEVRAGVSPSHRLSHDGDGDSWAVRPSALGSPAGTVPVRPGSERLRSLEGRQGRDRG